MYSEHDLKIWDNIFADVPKEWRHAPPSKAMQSCATWFRDAGVRDILDIGCGVGRWSIWLVKEGFQVWGADFAPRGVAYARQWAADEELDIPFSCSPITECAFPERKFDAVVATLVFDLVSTMEFEVAIEICRDALRPSGSLFAVFNPRKVIAEVEMNPTTGVTLIQYSDAEILEIVGNAGYQLVRQEILDQETRGFLWCRDQGFDGEHCRETGDYADTA